MISNCHNLYHLLRRFKCSTRLQFGKSWESCCFQGHKRTTRKAFFSRDGGRAKGPLLPHLLQKDVFRDGLVCILGNNKTLITSEIEGVYYMWLFSKMVWIVTIWIHERGNWRRTNWIHKTTSIPWYFYHPKQLIVFRAHLVSKKYFIVVELI